MLTINIQEVDWQEINVTASTTRIHKENKGTKILLTFGKPGQEDPVTGYYLSKGNAKYLMGALKAAMKLADW